MNTAPVRTRASTPAADSTPTDAPTPPAAGAPVIALTALTRSFGTGTHQVTAVAGVDLTIHRGEIVALLGPNGAGKTTTLDMLLGLVAPSTGTVRVFDQEPARAASDGRISAVLQSGGLLSDVTVREAVSVIASLHGREALTRVPEVLARTDLERIARRRIGKCSGGEQQRVKFALALVADPDILVLDEPTAGMDVTARRRFWEVMGREADRGRTVVFATHYLEEAEKFARRTVVMNHGRVVADAPTAQLRSGLGARTVRATLPEAGRDELLARLREDEAVTQLRVDAGRISLRANDSDAVASLLLSAAASDLEIAAPTLETAFTTLTED